MAVNSVAARTVHSDQTTPSRRLPRHVAIIMDGNGRWAQRQGLGRRAGHEAGSENIRRVIRHRAWPAPPGPDVDLGLSPLDRRRDGLRPRVAAWHHRR